MLLEGLQDSIFLQPRSTQMYYHLLTVKARDKAYLSHTSDSLILSVLRYYERRNDKKHLPEAYYYAGRVCADLQDAPQALGYYQKAADLLEGNKDYRLITVVYSQMGELFLYQDVYEEALKAYRKAYQYAAKLEDRRGIPRSYTVPSQPWYLHAKRCTKRHMVRRVSRSSGMRL